MSKELNFLHHCIISLLAEAVIKLAEEAVEEVSAASVIAKTI